MALDTAAKRFSMLGVCDSISASLPMPDGTLDAGDRAQFLSLYRGDDAEAPIGPPATGRIGWRRMFVRSSAQEA